MHRRKWFAAFAIAWTGGALGLGACGFPDVAFAPDGPNNEGGANGGEAAAPRDGSVGADGTSDPPDPETDAADDGDANPPSDAGDAGRDADAADGRVDSGSDGAPDSGADTGGPVNCDVDGDHHYDTTKAACVGMTPPDCDDSDIRVNKDANYLIDAISLPWYGDWNCDQVVQKLIPEPINCAGLDLTVLLSGGKTCTDIAGFTAVVQCGTLGTYVRCKKEPTLGLSCVVDATQTNTTTKQACR